MYDNNEEFAAIKSALKTPINILQNYATIRNAFQRSEHSRQKQLAKAQQNMERECFRNIRNYVNENGFVFTGQLTDIAICGDAGIPLKALNVSPKELKDAVLRTFGQAMNDGYISIQGDTIKLTEKGKSLIMRQGFFDNFVHAQKTRIEALNQQFNRNYKYVKLNGTDADLAAFKYTKSIDLTGIYNNPGQERLQAVMDNFKQLEKKGLVEIRNNIVFPKEKAIEKYLSKHPIPDMKLHDIDLKKSYRMKKTSNSAVKKHIHGKYKKGDLKVAKGKASSAAVKKTTATKAVKDGVKKTADTAVNTAAKVVPVGVVIKLSGSVLNMAKKSVASK